MKLLTILSILIMLTISTAYAQDRDAYGRTLDGGDGLLGAASVLPQGVPPSMFDLGLTLGAVGSNDETSSSEAAIVGASLWYYPNVSDTKKWLLVGARASWETGDRGRVEFSLVPDFLPFSNETSSLLWHFIVDVLPHYVVRTEANEYSSSAWTWKPGATVAIEYPMGNYGILVGASMNRMMSEEGYTEAQRTEIGAGAQVRLRLGR
jgi:hypothetical protein